MNTVQEIEAAIEKEFGEVIHKLPTSDIKELREWFENFREDQLEMADEFKASIQRGLKEMHEGQGRIHCQGY